MSTAKDDKSTAPIRLETLVLSCLRHFFPGIFLNAGTHVGGASCSEAVDGSKSCEHRTRGAFLDTYLIGDDKVVFVEVDEDRHKFYDKSCEMVRYEAVHFGHNFSHFPSVLLRFNPNVVEGEDTELLYRIKVLAQQIRDELKARPSDEQLEAAEKRVQFMYYGEGSEHQENLSENHKSSIVVSSRDIGKDHAPELDVDLQNFEYSMLKKCTIEESAMMLADARAASTYQGVQCSAFNNNDDMSKRHQCRSKAKKGETYCRRHFLSQQKKRILATISENKQKKKKQKKKEENSPFLLSLFSRQYTVPVRS